MDLESPGFKLGTFQFQTRRSTTELTRRNKFWLVYPILGTSFVGQKSACLLCKKVCLWGHIICELETFWNYISATNPLQTSAEEGALQIPFAVVFTPGTPVLPAGISARRRYLYKLLFTCVRRLRVHCEEWAKNEKTNIYSIQKDQCFAPHTYYSFWLQTLSFVLTKAFQRVSVSLFC